MNSLNHRGQSFEEAKTSTFEQYDAAMQRLADVGGEPDVSLDQAAKILNVSSNYVSKLLDEGSLPLITVYGGRQIRLSDLIAYKKRQNESSEAALLELQKQAQDLNMGY